MTSGWGRRQQWPLGVLHSRARSRHALHRLGNGNSRCPLGCSPSARRWRRYGRSVCCSRAQFRWRSSETCHPVCAQLRRLRGARLRDGEELADDRRRGRDQQAGRGGPRRVQALVNALGSCCCNPPAGSFFFPFLTGTAMEAASTFFSKSCYPELAIPVKLLSHHAEVVDGLDLYQNAGAYADPLWPPCRISVSQLFCCLQSMAHLPQSASNMCSYCVPVRRASARARIFPGGCARRLQVSMTSTCSTTLHWRSRPWAACPRRTPPAA